ncbi:MAG: RsmF rRNA methyltransferase first C-terminal domain-containing protein [Lachnospiraceae bacterium]|nr:RsmF rRNA methyltransferase first C-terminal domain-containing protein [Lachnospiraceae bacterium]
MEEQVRTRLPQAFVERMQKSLGAEAETFFESYDSPRAYGLRRNPLKMEREAFERQMPFSLETVSWAEEGYYYKETERPGRHPFHEMGLYYIQEPSAMCVVEVADPKPGEYVLDLCAAPGGKSTQIAGRMAGEGLLVCNEIVPNRAKILSQNIERLGVKNAVVLNHSPQELEARFASFFDRIIVDAPCSGEGMFHKEEAALTEWSPENVEMCAGRQKEILACAVNMLRPGGVLVYSTCTFAPAEDEDMVCWLREMYPDLELLPINTNALGISEGAVPGTGRIWPHRQRGEGHFVARFKKCGELLPHGNAVALSAASSAQDAVRSNGKGKKGKRDRSGVEHVNVWGCYEAFAAQSLCTELSGKRLEFGDQLYLVPDGMPDLKGLRVVRPGLHLGTNKKNRFEPSHALALALRASEAVQVWETEEPEKYLRGETLSCDSSLKGWTLITCEGQPVGWGKADRGILKNHYPKGLRISW